MAVPSLVELAEAGAHFGHHRSLTFPKAKDFVYMVKSNVALIDLEQTQAAIEQAQKVINEHRVAGKGILIVGTKRSIRNLVAEVAEAIGASYINERWFGGTLTNFATMHENIKRMNDLEEFLGSDKAAKLSKKDRLKNTNRLERYHRFLKGLGNMNKLPELIVLASASQDAIAIEEANQLEIPVLAITDTDMNPVRITYPIPANDDAPRAIELILRAIVNSPAPKTAAKVAEVEIAPETETLAAVEVEVPKRTAKKAVKSKTEPKAKKPTPKKPAVKKGAAKIKK